MAKIELELEDILKIATGFKQNNSETFGRYVIVRTYSAGVFAGFLEKMDGKIVTLKNVRRIWHWEGAATLSELAQFGTSKPTECKFPCEVDSIIITEAIEILNVTNEARDNIKKVPIWKS